MLLWLLLLLFFFLQPSCCVSLRLGRAFCAVCKCWRRLFSLVLPFFFVTALSFLVFGFQLLFFNLGPRVPRISSFVPDDTAGGGQSNSTSNSNSSSTGGVLLEQLMDLLARPLYTMSGPDLDELLQLIDVLVAPLVNLKNVSALVICAYVRTYICDLYALHGLYDLHDLYELYGFWLVYYALSSPRLDELLHLCRTPDCPPSPTLKHVSALVLRARCTYETCIICMMCTYGFCIICMACIYTMSGPDLDELLHVCTPR